MAESTRVQQADRYLKVAVQAAESNQYAMSQTYAALAQAVMMRELLEFDIQMMDDSFLE